jgi:sterol-4alpha-carboxylate 3-dehydrogenase (decarboxylating)
MDAWAEQANKEDEDKGGEQIAGQAFFITNGEPVYFWDFTRTVWRNLGHVPPPIWTIPTSFGEIIATIAEYASWFTGKEPGFTKFRVAQATLNRCYDIEKARRLLGYEPIVGLDDGMKRWTDWYKGELEKQNLVQESEKTK